MIRQLQILATTCLISLPAFSYIVKEGDTLAKIAQKYYEGAVFGKNGSIEKLLIYNPHVKNANNVPPGTELKFKKEFMKAGMVDPDAPVDPNALAEEDEADSEQGLNPAIEIEKYDSPQNALLKDSPTDKVNFFANFVFNNFEATDQNTNSNFFFTTSTETNVGIEYVKSISEFTSLFLSLAYNQAVLAADTTTTPPLIGTEKGQVAAILGGRFLFTEDNYFNFSVNYIPHYYLSLNTNGNRELEHVGSPSYSLSTENQFYKNKDFIIGFDLGFEYITNPKSTGRGLDATIGYTIGLIYQQEFKNNDRIKVKLDVNQTNLDTADYKLADTSMILNFIYSLPY